MKVTIALEQNLFPLVDGLRKQAFFHANTLKKIDSSLDVNLLTINSNRPLTNLNFTLDNKSYFSFYFVKTDILHYFGTPSPILYLLLKFAKFKKFYLTLTDGELGCFWESPLSRLCGNLLNKLDCKIFVHTNYQKKIAKKYFKNKIELIEPFIESYSQVSKKSKNPRLLFMSHLSKFKGFDLVIDSYSKLLSSFPKLELVVADSGLNKKSKEYYYKINLLKKKGAKIILKTKINPELELSKAWIYLYPITSTHNTFAVPISLYESYQCNTPFICSNVGSLNEYFDKYFLIKIGSIIELSRKIELLIKNFKSLDLQKAIKKSISNRGTSEKYLRRYIDD